MEYALDILLYLSVFLISTFFVYCGLSIGKKSRIGFIIAFVGLLIPSIMAGIRYEVGMDYNSYIGMYRNVVDGHTMYYRPIEPASAMLINISAYFQSSIFMFFSFSFITNVVFLIAFWKILGKDAKKVALAFFLFLCILFSTTLNAMRTGVSIAFATLAFSYLLSDKEKHPILKSLLFIFVSFLFHKSGLLALVFVPPFVLAKKYKGRHILTKKVLLWVIYLIVGAFLPFVFPEWRDFFVISDYSRYLNSFNGDFSIPLADIMMFIIILWSLIRFYRTIKYREDKEVNKLFYCASFYLPLSASVGWLTYADGLSRITFLLVPLVICLMVYLILKSNKKYSFIDFVTIALLIVITSLMFFRNLNWSGALPYQTVFNEEISYACLY